MRFSHYRQKQKRPRNPALLLLKPRSNWDLIITPFNYMKSWRVCATAWTRKLRRSCKMWHGLATYRRASPERRLAAAAKYQKCYRYRHGTPVIYTAVRLHGGKLQSSAGIMVFKSFEVTLNVQPHRLIQEYGRKSACKLVWRRGKAN